MKFMSILLKEGRKEDLKKKYASKFEGRENDLDWILSINDLIDFNHKYTDWVLKQMDMESGNFDTDVEVAVRLIKDFDKYQSQLEKKDINQYETIHELETTLKPVLERAEEKQLAKQAEKIYEDDKFVVIKPKTHRASCKYGANTKWCTSSKDDQHFKRYTNGGQELYYIINKTNSTNQNYSKVAIHFDSGGYAKYWDSQDTPMSERETSVLNYAFPEMIQAIEDDFKRNKTSRTDEYLNKVFNSQGSSIRSRENFLGKNNLYVQLEGFETIDDMEFGHAYGTVSIFLNNRLIDSYSALIMFSQDNENSFKIDVGFSGNDLEEHEQDLIDLDLESSAIKYNFLIQNRDPKFMADALRNFLVGKIEDYVQKSPKLLEKLVGTSKVFTPTYGYTFGKNKGWVKKLVDYLDSSKVGTKLDFLTDVGYLEKMTQDGKTKFRKTKGKFIYNPRDLRGQFASFFAAAKNAGILGYRKEGKDFFLIKGPNFDAFKSGELIAL